MTCVIIAHVPTTEANMNETNERRDEDMSAWITVKAAAEILDLTEHAIRYLCREDILTAIKPGRDWLIQRESVEAYHKSGTGRPRKATGN